MVIEFGFLFSSQKTQKGEEEGLCKTALQEKYFMISSKKKIESTFLPYLHNTVFQQNLRFYTLLFLLTHFRMVGLLSSR